MLPQDETDGDCSALFLQGLVMAHYVRSPRYEKASSQTNSKGDGGDGEERVSAEARDIALEVGVKAVGRFTAVRGSSAGHRKLRFSLWCSAHSVH